MVPTQVHQFKQTERHDFIYRDYRMRPEIQKGLGECDTKPRYYDNYYKSHSSYGHLSKVKMTMLRVILFILLTEFN